MKTETEKMQILRWHAKRMMEDLPETAAEITEILTSTYIGEVEDIRKQIEEKLRPFIGKVIYDYKL